MVSNCFLGPFHWINLDELKDLRFGLRMLAKHPGTTAVITLTLALAIGIDTAVFSVLNSAVLQSLPVRNADRLVILTDPNASMVLGGLLTGERSLLTFPEFSKLRDGIETVSGLCASQLTLERWPAQRANASPEQVRGRLVSENYFSVLGVEPALGRFFTQEDLRAVGADPYAVVSYNYWQKSFGGSPAILGTHLRLRQASVVVIGVTAKGFRGETVGQEPDVWLPMMMAPLVMSGGDWLHDTLGDSQDKFMWLHAIGRRKAGVTVAQVQAEANVLFQRILEADYPASMDPSSRKDALHQSLVVRQLEGGAFHGRKEFTQQWMLLLGLASLVLLVACVNVANLLLARAAGRSREVAIRLSLGASRIRLVWQFMLESLLLAMLGGVGGLIVAEVAMHGLVRMLPGGNETFSMAVGLDGRVLVFSATLTVAAAIVFGLAPAVRATGRKIDEDLKENGRGTIWSRRRASFAKTLVVAQVALSLLLATGAGLFLRTLWNLQAVELGYPRDNLLLILVDSFKAGYEGERAARFRDEMLSQLRDTPGVVAVSDSGRGLFSGFEGSSAVFDVDGFESQKEQDRGSTDDSVGPGYFSTIRIPILLGREFELRDMTKRPSVCVINEAFAKHFFGGRNPIGMHFSSVLSDDDGKSEPRRLEVIGVARDVRVQSMRAPIDPKFYVAGGGEWFEVRGRGDVSQLLPVLQKEILAKDSNLVIDSAKTLSETVDNQNAQPRLVARMATLFGGLALMLTTVGVYGLLSYGVACRTNEIGIRVALGADTTKIAGMIFKETGFLLSAGAMVGFVATLGVVRVLATQLYGLNDSGARWSLARYEQVDSSIRLFGLGALDPLTIAVVIVVLFGLGLVASYLPAARAARVEPVQALRNE